MSLYMNIDEFRQYHMDAMACKYALNEYANQMSDDEKRFEILFLTINTYGYEMLKKLIANTILDNEEAYSMDVIAWAKNTPVRKFFYETDELLREYIPNKLNSALVEKIAADLIEKESHRDMVTTAEGFRFEILKTQNDCYLFSYENEAKQTLYIVAEKLTCNPHETPIVAEELEQVFVRYQDGLIKYNQYLEYSNMRKLLSDKLYNEFQDFKAAMLENDKEMIFESAYMISKLQDFHIIIDNMPLTSDEVERLMQPKNVLQNLYNKSMSVENVDGESIINDYLLEHSTENYFSNDEDIEL